MIVRDYVRNYRTNQEIVKIKEKNGDIQGIATIQLFDAKTGALELEAKTHNIIYQAVYDWLKSYQWDKFCAGAFNKTNTYQGYFNMDNIYLTTSTLPENTPYNLFNYDGLTIGWANKSTYVGSDTQRGTPNSAETYANNEKIHWVFDWSTHAANGTFQTIIWSNTLALTGIYEGPPINVGINTGTNQSGFGLACDGSYLYALSRDGKLYKLTTSGTLISGPINVGINTGWSYAGFGLTYDGSYLYALSYDGKLYKLTTSGTLISGPINVGINTGYYAGFGLTYDGSYLYALSPDGGLYKLTTSGTLISGPIGVGIDIGYTHANFGLTYDGSYLYALNWNGKLYKLTTSETLINGPINVGINTGTDRSGFGFACDGSYLYALSWDGMLYKNINAYASYFARTRLAAPVTKTNQNTMKVIYEFIRS